VVWNHTTLHWRITCIMETICTHLAYLDTNIWHILTQAFDMCWHNNLLYLDTSIWHVLNAFSTHIQITCISICVYWGFPFLMRSVRLSVYDGSVWYVVFSEVLCGFKQLFDFINTCTCILWLYTLFCYYILLK
jgi:hypothetical protein